MHPLPDTDFGLVLAALPVSPLAMGIHRQIERVLDSALSADEARHLAYRRRTPLRMSRHLSAAARTHAADADSQWSCLLLLRDDSVADLYIASLKRAHERRHLRDAARLTRAVGSTPSSEAA